MSTATLPVSIQAHIEGDVTGQVAIGNNILQIGSNYGGVVNYYEATEPPKLKPLPYFQRPKPFPGLLDRANETADVRTALSDGTTVELTGEDGSGKTSLLRKIANDPIADEFPDGIVYLPTRRLAVDDLLQNLYDAFFVSSSNVKPTRIQLRDGLQERRALFLLDNVELERNEVEEVVGAATSSTFVLASEVRRAWDDVRSIAISGLPDEDAITLFAREAGVDPANFDRDSARKICNSVGNHPLRILQAGARARERGMPSAEAVVGEPAAAEQGSQQKTAARVVLSALLALGGASAHADALSAVAQAGPIEPLLDELQRAHLVVARESMYRALPSQSVQVPPVSELSIFQERYQDYFVDWMQRQRRSPQEIVKQSGSIIAVLEGGVAGHRSTDVLALAKGLEGPLAIAKQWETWAMILQYALNAARELGDKSSEAWAQHQLGTRDLCLDERKAARFSLEEALRMRVALGDTIGAEITRHNLSLLFPPTPPDNGQEGNGSDPPSLPTGTVQGVAAVVETVVLAKRDNGNIVNGEKPPAPNRIIKTAVAVGATAVLVVGGTLASSWWKNNRPVILPTIRVNFSIERNGIDFGQIEIGGSTNKTLKVSNTENRAIKLAISGVQAPFSLKSDANPTVNAGSAYELRVAFHPDTDKSLQQIIEITGTDEAGQGRSAKSITVSGSGKTLPPRTPRISFNPQELKFGGFETGAPGKKLSVTIINPSDFPLHVRGIEKSGNDSDLFTIPGAPLAPFQIEPHQERPISIAFLPLRDGPASAILRIFDDASGAPHEVSLSGSGKPVVIAALPGKLELSTPSLDFRSVPLGETRGPQPIVVRNTGGTPVNIQPVELTGRNSTDFKLSPAPGQSMSIKPGRPLNLSVEFTPGGPNARNARITIRTENGETLTAELTGTGTGKPVAEIDRSKIDFGACEWGETSEVETVTITNSGNAPLHINKPSRGGANSDEFNVTISDSSGPIAPNSSRPLHVTFRPGGLGSRTGVLTLRTNASREPRTIELSGTGRDSVPPPAPQPRSPSMKETLRLGTSEKTKEVPLEWEAVTDVSGISRYNVELMSRRSKTPVSAPSVSGSATLATLGPGDYQWHVQAVDGAGNKSNWSTWYGFVVARDQVNTVLPVPRLRSPDQKETVMLDPNEKVKRVLLEWEVSRDRSAVARFDIELMVLRTKSPVTVPSVSGTTVNTSLAPGVYGWHVRAVSSAGRTGDWSDWWQFTVTRTSQPPRVRIVRFIPQFRSINVGESAVLSYLVENAANVTIDHGLRAGGTRAGRITTGPLRETTTFTLTATGADGSVDTRETMITVQRTVGGGTIGTPDEPGRGVTPQDPEGTRCGFNIRQLATALLMFARDQDGRLPLTAGEFKTKLRPYLKTERVFRCPDDAQGPESYAFNSNLEKVTMASINRPADTIMIYEGRGNRLDYRHQGKAWVALADGHCRLVGPGDLRKLTWMPGSLTPFPGGIIRTRIPKSPEAPK